MVVVSPAELFTSPDNLPNSLPNPSTALEFILAQLDLSTRLYLLRDEAFSECLVQFDEQGNFLG
jgi:hypothetical protein